MVQSHATTRLLRRLCMLLEDRIALTVPTLTPAQDPVRASLLCEWSQAGFRGRTKNCLMSADRNTIVSACCRRQHRWQARRDGLGREGACLPPAVRAEVQRRGQRGSRRPMASWRWCALGRMDAPPIPSICPRLQRALLISSADIGEVMMRAFILAARGVSSRAAASGLVIPGAGTAPPAGYGSASRSFAHAQQLSALADRCGCRRRGQGSGRTLSACYPADLPILICPNGTLMRHPMRDAEGRASALGSCPISRQKRYTTVSSLGQGPLGLGGRAVYAASEGLNVLVLDMRRSFGEAKPVHSSRIRKLSRISHLISWSER